jgi:glucosyl-3-phosphoglycerate synthase
LPDIPPEVAGWFATHTFDGTRFDAATLAEAKGSRSISVLIPAKDEADTVGAIIRTIRADLMHQVDLVDEVIVIDSHSTDGTAEAAEAAGATVFHVDDLLPQVGSRTGKGEAMWKALAVMGGDIGVYVDGDIEDFAADFVVGLVGPLLLDPELAFVKGFYDRPWTSGPAAQPAGGGRVTELVARRLVLDRVPLLAGFVQPLAGEYAFQRDAFMAVPYVSDYGVDIGLMVDVLRDRGLAAMAQVDLGSRIHRHQGLAALTVMAQQVHAAFDLRLAPESIDTVASPSVSFARDSSGEMRLVPSTTTTSQRPPMRDITG